MIRLMIPALLLTAAPASATEFDEAKPISQPRPGDAWVKVTYDIDDGEAMSCQVLETNIDAETGQRVCAAILNRWKFARGTKDQSITQYVVIKPKP